MGAGNAGALDPQPSSMHCTHKLNILMCVMLTTIAALGTAGLLIGSRSPPNRAGRKGNGPGQVQIMTPKDARLEKLSLLK